MERSSPEREVEAKVALFKEHFASSSPLLSSSPSLRRNEPCRPIE